MRVFLALGSNLGDKIGYIIKALDGIRDLAEIRSVSTVYESKAWGYKKQPAFLNLVVEVRTFMEPHSFFLQLRKIERRVGRRERFKWGPREIDIDILLWGERIINSKMLRIPHPHLKERDFFLYPLLEIDDNLVDPLSGKPLKEHKLENRLKPFCSIINF